MTRPLRLLVCATLITSLSLATACDPKKPEANATPPAATTASTAAQADPGAAATPKADDKKADDSKPAEATVATIGKPAPSFTLKDEAGAEHSLDKLKGKIVVLEWTNPGCPYVVRHTKDKTMIQALEKLPKDKVAWLTIDSSKHVTPDASAAWKKEHNITTAFLQDPEGAVGKQYGAKTTPHMFVLDAEGVVRYAGAIDDDPKGEKKPEDRKNYVIEAVQALDKGEAVPTAETQPYGCSVKYKG